MSGAEGALAWETGLVPMVGVMRGGAPELVHRGVAACVDSLGEVIAGEGDEQQLIHLRSAAKPFQALALVETGAADALGVSSEELALACGSHRGASEHVAVVTGFLERLGVPAEALVCGGVDHMCSGKHAAMIALGVFLGLPYEGYQQPSHGVQRTIAQHVAAEAGLPPDDILDGIDGCGVPVFRMSAARVAHLYARLAAGSTPALARIRDAMLAHPALVAGEGLFDTELMREAGGRIIAKMGADGVQAVAWRSAAGAAAQAVVLKLCAAGAVVYGTAAALLLRWGLEDIVPVRWAQRWLQVRNVRDEVVGEIIPLWPDGSEEGPAT